MTNVSGSTENRWSYSNAMLYVPCLCAPAPWGNRSPCFEGLQQYSNATASIDKTRNIHRWLFFFMELICNGIAYWYIVVRILVSGNINKELLSIVKLELKVNQEIVGIFLPDLKRSHTFKPTWWVWIRHYNSVELFAWYNLLAQQIFVWRELRLVYPLKLGQNNAKEIEVATSRRMNWAETNLK